MNPPHFSSCCSRQLKTRREREGDFFFVENRRYKVTSHFFAELRDIIITHPLLICSMASSRVSTEMIGSTGPKISLNSWFRCNQISGRNRRKNCKRQTHSSSRESPTVTPVTTVGSNPRSASHLPPVTILPPVLPRRFLSLVK